MKVAVTAVKKQLTTVTCLNLVVTLLYNTYRMSNTGNKLVLHAVMTQSGSLLKDVKRLHNFDLIPLLRLCVVLLM